MKRFLLVMLVASCMLSLGSCSNMARKMSRKVKLEGVENVQLISLSQLRIDFRIMNQTAYKLQLEDAEASLYYRDVCIGTMHLKECVEVPKRTESELVETYWAVEVGNPLTLLPLVGKLRKGDLSEMWVELEVKGHGGPAPVNLSYKKMPLSEFLRTFGVDPSELMNFLN